MSTVIKNWDKNNWLSSKHYIFTGGAILNLWIVPLMLLVGFLTPWPYNYWRLKKFGMACH